MGNVIQGPVGHRKAQPRMITPYLEANNADHQNLQSRQVSKLVWNGLFEALGALSVGL